MSDEHPAPEITPNYAAVARNVWLSIAQDRVLLTAAGMTFYLMMAIFPAMMAFVSVYGLALDPATLTDHLAAVDGLLPAAATDLVAGRLAELVGEPAGDLTLGFMITLLIALWSAGGGVKAMIQGLNIAYGLTEKRNFLRISLLAVGFTLGAMVLILLLAVLLAVVPAILALVPLGRWAEAGVSLARWPVMALVIALALAVLYRHGPSRSPPPWRWITPGSAFATVAWIAATIGFTLYLTYFADFDATYGALAAPIGFLLWVWVSMVVVILGGEINAEVEATEVNSTLENKGVAR